MKALVVDDSNAMRTLLAELLRERDYDVVTASSGEEALRIQAESTIDLMLVDWTLPGISGLDVCRAVRSQGARGRDTVILVVTARDRAEDLAAVLDAGASDYLAKPIDTDILRTRLMIAERTVRDAARRREAEAALAQSESRFERLVQNLPGMAFRCEVEGVRDLTFQYVSDGIEDLLRLSPAYALREPRAVLFALDGGRPGAFLREIVRAIASGRFEPFVHRIVLGDATVRWVHVLGRATRRDDGVTVVDGLMIDVTEQRRAEDALKASEEAFRTLIEASPDGVLVSRQGRVVYGNPRLVEMLGHKSASDLVGRPFTEFVHADDRAATANKLSGGAVELPARPEEIRLLRRDGRTILGEVTIMPVVFGGSRAMLLVLRDLTEQKEMQHRLLLADRMASVGTLAAGVAHELNNPLAYVLSNIKLLREDLERAPRDAQNEAYCQQLDEAIHGAERMRHIVRDLKTFSRIDDEHRGSVEIPGVLESSIHICWNEIRHRAKLVKNLGKTPLVQINESRLGQVFLNLLINAAQAMPDRPVELNRIAVTTRTADDGWAVIEVRDNGEGITDEDVTRIFDPFFTTKRGAEGTGLGLAICHNIVTGAGGVITVQSRRGEGTVFEVRLPPGAKAQHRRSSQSLPTITVGRKGKVVVIDDELLVGRSIQRALSEHEVAVFQSATLALDSLVAQASAVDVVFCDLMMPEMSGADVFAEVQRKRPELASRFVFMTGGAFTPKAREFLEATTSTNEFLEKPFDVRQIREIVRARVATR